MADSEQKEYWGYLGLVFGALLILIFVLTAIGHDERITALEESKELSSVEVKLEQPEFLLKDPREGLMEALEYYGIPEPEIVYAQAYLETGNFNIHNRNVNNNNIFGLYNSKMGRYMIFDHWVGSVECYKKCFSDRYTDTTEDYYHFLTRVRYSADPKYSEKVKQIRKQLFNHD